MGKATRSVGAEAGILLEKGQTRGARGNVSRLAMQFPVYASHQMRLTPAAAQERTRRSCSAIFVACVLALGCCAVGPASARTFGGYDCTDNCVGHAAGYRWAEERGIENIDECPVNSSDAFYEGCLTYVDDPERGADLDDDGVPILVPKRASN